MTTQNTQFGSEEPTPQGGGYQYPGLNSVVPGIVVVAGYSGGGGGFGPPAALNAGYSLAATSSSGGGGADSNSGMSAFGNMATPNAELNGSVEGWS